VHVTCNCLVEEEFRSPTEVVSPERKALELGSIDHLLLVLASYVPPENKILIHHQGQDGAKQIILPLPIFLLPKTYWYQSSLQRVCQFAWLLASSPLSNSLSSNKVSLLISRRFYPASNRNISFSLFYRLWVVTNWIDRSLTSNTKVWILRS